MSGIPERPIPPSAVLQTEQASSMQGRLGIERARHAVTSLKSAILRLRGHGVSVEPEVVAFEEQERAFEGITAQAEHQLSAAQTTSPGSPVTQPEERAILKTQPTDIVPLLEADIAAMVAGSIEMQTYDSHTGTDVWGQPSTFREDQNIAHHGGFPAFWQEHGGDFGNGVIETAGLNALFIGLAALVNRGRISYRTLAYLRIFAMGLSLLSVAVAEVKPLADFFNQHLMSVGNPDILDFPAGAAGSVIPAGVDALNAERLRWRQKRRLKAEQKRKQREESHTTNEGSVD